MWWCKSYDLGWLMLLRFDLLYSSQNADEHAILCLQLWNTQYPCALFDTISRMLGKAKWWSQKKSKQMRKGNSLFCFYLHCFNVSRYIMIRQLFSRNWLRDYRGINTDVETCNSLSWCWLCITPQDALCKDIISTGDYARMWTGMLAVSSVRGSFR